MIYVIKYAADRFDEKSLESAESRLFETDVCFKLPNRCPNNLRCAVIDDFIYVLTLDGDMNRLEA